MGAQRWISLGPLGTFQPSEPAKLVIAISLAAVLCRGTYENLQELWKPLLAVAIPALLILKQPDLGTSLVLLAILTVELFFALPKLGDFGIYALARAASSLRRRSAPMPCSSRSSARGSSSFSIRKADPQGAGYNLNQSKIAVGNGEWFGRGLYHGTQTQLNFVPEHSRDFIFTVLAEEWGFAGALLLARTLRCLALRRGPHDAGRPRPFRLSARLGFGRHALLSRADQPRHDGRHHADHRASRYPSCRMAARRCSPISRRSASCSISTRSATAASSATPNARQAVERMAATQGRRAPEREMRSSNVGRLRRVTKGRRRQVF